MLLIIVAQEIYSKGYFKTLYLAIIGQKEEKEIVTGISINNVNLVYDHDSDIYYFPIKIVDEKNETNLNIKVNSSKILRVKIENEVYGNNVNLKKNINYNTIIEMDVESLLYKNKKCIIKFTNLPIISMNFNEDEVNIEEYTYAQFLLIDPDYNEHNSKYQLYSDSEVRYRGSSSMSYEKKPYRVKFSKDKKTNLLGMEKNKTWILDAIASDDSKVRTKIASDLWNYMNEDLNPKEYTELNSKYVELYINGSYKGLYLLKETVDEDLLNLEKSGTLIKGIGWDWPDFRNYEKIETDKYACFELKYPKKSEEYSKSWIDFLNRMKRFYNDEQIDYNTTNEIFYINNLINHRVFILALNANDNYEFRNIYYSIKDDKVDTRLLITPWDFDLTFGAEWDAVTGPTKYYDRVNSINEPFRIRSDYMFIQRLKERWRLLYNIPLSKESVYNMIDEQYNYLIKAGALERENNKNKESVIDMEKEVQEVKDWYSQRVEIVNKYIEAIE